MKTLTKKLSVIGIALVLFMITLFTMGGIQTAKANGPSDENVPAPGGDSGNQYTIYYFTDYYPTVSYNELLDEFGNYNIVYDHQYIDEQDFENMVNNHYFLFDSVTGEDTGIRALIIDIKTFLPDSMLLESLFADVKFYMDCATVYVSYYDAYEYYDTTFLNYVDLFVVDSQLARLNYFIEQALNELYNGSYATLFDVSYLIDGNLVDVVNLFGEDMDTLCENSHFLRIFLEQFVRVVWDYEYDVLFSSYNEIADYLRDILNVKLLVHKGGNEYVDILTWNVYQFNNIYDVLNVYPNSLYTCAFGFWRLNHDYYQFLLDAQNVDDYDLPVYILEAEPIPYDPDGLNIITDSDLGFYIESDDAAMTLLYGLHDLLD